ncbi:MAG: DUF1624 domain-containing protein [Planctomycetaceae bacterium]|nr:DUF1624 domain-containing protein [Planctomycetaceae bacterium]
MRYPSIDILRTIAIFVMVFVHFGENLSGYGVPFAGFGAPLFAFLSGVSYRLWVNGQQRKGVDEELISKISIRRGLFVFGVGIAFNVLVWLPEDTFNWDVLTMIGTALLVLNLIRSLPLPVPVVMAVMLVLISPILRDMAEYNAYWVNKYYEHDMTLSDITIGFLSVGYFPIFPWLAFSLMGYVVAVLMFGDASESDPAPGTADDDADSVAALRLPFILGTSLVLLSMALLIGRNYLPDPIAKRYLGGWHMFPPTIEYVCGTLGMALLLFGVLHHVVDRNPRSRQWTGLLRIAKTFSRYSFTIYILHHVVHLYPLWLYALLQGQEPTTFWASALPVHISLPLGLLFMICCYFTLNWLGPERRIGIESWMRWLCD